jgi:hypothetical protein
VLGRELFPEGQDLSSVSDFPAVPSFDGVLTHADIGDELADQEGHADDPRAAGDAHVNDVMVVNVDRDVPIAERFNFAGTQAISPDAFITRASVNSPTLVPLIKRFFRPVTAHNGLSTGLLPSMPLEIKPIPIMPLSITQSAHDVRPHRCEDAHA